ncbi:MAG: baseplate J/gp47 family protein [Pseudomonadota bacterium]
MPFSRPTINQLIEGVTSDLRGRLEVVTLARRSVVGVLSRVMAGAVHGVYGFVVYLSKQIFPDTADGEHLARWAAVWGIQRKPVLPAQGHVVFSGIPGGVIPSGILLKATGGVMYRTEASATMPVKGTILIPVIAEQAGQEGNVIASESLTLVEPLEQIVNKVTIAEPGLIGGTNEESDDSLRARVVNRIQQPPHGGNENDYKTWALEQDAHGVPVTRAWVAAQERGVGTVTVRFMTDGIGNGIPDAPAVKKVQNYIDRVRPITADVALVAPIPKPFNVRLAKLQPDHPEVRAAIEEAVKAMVEREAVPGQALLMSHLREVISTSAGEYDHQVLSPTQITKPARGEIYVFGGVIYDDR